MRRPAFPDIHAALYRCVARLSLIALLGTAPSACDSGPGEQPDGSPVPGPDADVPASDASQPAPPLAVAHVPPAGSFAGTGQLILRDGAVIDTTALTIDGQSYGGGPGAEVVFDMWEQTPEGPELAVLHVHDFGVENGSVTVRGTRPLVIIAGNEIRLAGLLDAGARGAEPGPGGFASGMGAGAGGVGLHVSNQDGGGGGGGHGSAGGAGGDGICVGDACGDGGAGGAVSGTAELDVLQGGAGGGAGAVENPSETCVPAPGGGGGGAVQLTALDRIRIDPGGGVHVGGGGGAGGSIDQGCADSGSGGGGGAGGAIFLQAPLIEHSGVLAANGGGGGSGANGGQQNPGSDALAGAEAAPGAEAVDSVAFAGGCGAALVSTECSQDGSGGNGNGGGGGGGVGRIAVVVSDAYDDAEGVTSPAASVAE